MITIYVDDMIITWSNYNLIREFKTEMKRLFEMTDLGFVNSCSGIDVQQEDD